MKVIVLLTPLALFACSPQQQANEPRKEAPASAVSPVTTASSSPAAPVEAPQATVALPGEYRIAGVDGAEINQPYAITAAITADRIHVTADCLNFAWDYTLRSESIATERVAVEGCGRGLTAAEEAVVAAFDSASTAVRTPANAIELRGAGRSVTLFSQ